MSNTARTRTKRREHTSVALKSRLGRRLMIWVLVISAVNALIATSVQLTYDYRRDMSDLNNALSYIEQNLASGIGEAIYNYDANQLNVQLEAISGSLWVAGVGVRYGPNHNKDLTYGQVDHSREDLKIIELKISNGHKVFSLGSLYIAPNFEVVRQRTISRINLVLLTQSVKTFIVSMSILLLFATLVTRHLRRIADFAATATLSGDDSPLALSRAKGRQPDELDELVDSINRSWIKLKQSRKREAELMLSLERKVDLRTAELKKANEQLAQLSTTDALTQLANRRKFDDLLNLELRKARRDQSHITLALIDVDNFKAFNDTYGHQAGDECLKSISGVLQSFSRRPGDLAARYGGEEFAIVLTDMSVENAEEYAHLVRQSIQDLQIANEGSKHGVITVSIGISVVKPDSDFVAEEIIEMADLSLYAVKNSGRNGVELSTFSI
ncbi:diguanylate cyclase [Vibrio sp. SCSIO 43136]|uniref:sensor domain-containing diguanylate cyclase n=1 Tax=Vibrio sp. SCSIO 43136 TaxID=2819101 RepID=UPI0020765191|nr:diguanylate cyclase [Vibrio sp. SCSIO 43136]USD66988.1 diguanylate cyclase [Vibrio sp. SCSIO 43136]